MNIRYHKTVYIEGIKFIIESERSIKFIDDWVQYLTTAPPPISERGCFECPSPAKNGRCDNIPYPYTQTNPEQ